MMQAEKKSKLSHGNRAIVRFLKHKAAVVSLVFLAIVMLAAVLAPFVAPYPPEAIVGPFSGPPSAEHVLGTDQVGRDVLSRLIYASRITLFVGLASTAIAAVIGGLLGLLAGYFGGWVDAVIMRFTDMVMSFPYLMLVLVAAAIVGPGLANMVLILGFVNWPGIARLIRASVLSIKEAEYVKNSIVQGMPLRFILFSEILPGALPPALVYATTAVAWAMLDEAALSFLGMGIQSPTASLGNMLNGAQSLTVLTSKPWLWLPAGIMIILLVMAVNFIGDAVRDAIDPHDA